MPPKDRHKVEKVQFRLTPDQRSAAEAEAGALGVTVNELARRRLVGSSVRAARGPAPGTPQRRAGELVVVRDDDAPPPPR